MFLGQKKTKNYSNSVIALSKEKMADLIGLLQLLHTKLCLPLVKTVKQFTLLVNIPQYNYCG